MNRKIRKILIANRGEIALRIIRTCREMTITTVAIYSEADADAPYVRLADESYLIGPPPARESYLGQERIIRTAIESGADAIHPGYGFLSENADFADAVTEAGLIFVGPPGPVIRRLGDKTKARQLARSLGIPMIPGTIEAITSDLEAIRACEEIGYPVLIKAAAGGGGKGMRAVRSGEELKAALRDARSEALSSFGDDRIYIERLLQKPRHIEIQVLADAHGSVVHLGERECSIQRRHQKIIEESPSARLPDSVRQAMASAAVKLSAAAGYVNAGTVEFLVDADWNFYFMEVNTRLQVEHPVTEMRTGIDLVQEQILVACGAPLAITQASVHFSGHSMECRIYAEDPSNSFFPSSGLIGRLRAPTGVGTREDRGVEEGSIVSTYYDPMLAKLITHGRDREEARRRLVRALKEYELNGVCTNIDYCLLILSHPKYIDSDIDISFIEREIAFPVDASPLSSEERVAVALAASLVRNERDSPNLSIPTEARGSRWKVHHAND